MYSKEYQIAAELAQTIHELAEIVPAEDHGLQWNRDELLEQMWDFVEVTIENMQENIACVEPFQLEEAEDALDQARADLDYAIQIYTYLVEHPNIVLYDFAEDRLLTKDPETGELNDVIN